MSRTKRVVLAVCAAISVPALTINAWVMLTATSRLPVIVGTVGVISGWVALTGWALTASRREQKRGNQ